MCDLENVDVMLGSYSRGGSLTSQNEDDIDVDLEYNKLQQNTTPRGGL